MCSTRPHRHSIFCILPPHLLREIARHGTARQRDFALETLATDATVRGQRAQFQLLPQGAHKVLAVPRALTPAGEPAKHRTIYTADHTASLPGTVVRAEGQGPTGDPAADEAYGYMGDTFDFYWAAYQRDSIDDAGMPLVGTVHYQQDYDNAFWNGQQMVYGDGDGDLFNRFTIAVDVIGHELTHGVSGNEVNLRYLGQSGALNESVSDVFGSLVKQYVNGQTADQADWLIGQGLFTAKVHGVALRSMKAPGTAYDDPTLGKDPQPAAMSGYVHTAADNGGVHINSGIPNHAFYLAATALGGHAWEKAGRIWYETIRDPALKSTATFAQFARVTAANAAKVFGAAERQAVVTAWEQVGIGIH